MPDEGGVMRHLSQVATVPMHARAKTCGVTLVICLGYRTSTHSFGIPGGSQLPQHVYQDKYDPIQIACTPATSVAGVAR